MNTSSKLIDTITDLVPVNVPWTDSPRLKKVTDEGTTRVSESLIVLSYWCAFITLGVGVTSLVGWILDQPYLRNLISPDLPIANSTSMSLMFLGVSLLYAIRGANEGDSRSAITTSQIATVPPILISLAVIGSYLGWLQADIDQILFRVPMESLDRIAPGVNAPNSAICVLVSAIALLLMEVKFRSKHRPFQYLVGIPLVISLSALVGHAYKLPFLSGEDGHIFMILPTAFAFLVLSIGILCARPREGLMVVISNGDAGGMMARTLIPAAIGLPILFGWLRVAGENEHLVTDEQGSILLVIAMITTFFWIIWRTSRQLGKMDTARRLASEALHESADRTRSILERAYDAFVAIDKNGRILDWNPQAERTFGWTREEVVGKTLEETIIPQHLTNGYKDTLKSLSFARINESFNKRIELAAMHKEGHEFPIELAAFPVGTEETGTMCAFLHDISQRKAHEEEVTCLNKALLEQITEAGSKNDSLKLLTDELRTACERAIESSKAKSDFIASLSHEIRTPLSSVIGMAELILEGDLNEDQTKLANTLYSSAHNLLGIVNDILDLSKIEAKKLELSHEIFDMRALVEDVAEMFGTSARSKGLSLSTFVDPALPTSLKGDPKRLRQILVNLCGNALKFTETGSVFIRVEKLSLSDHAVTFNASVIDTGIGLSDEARSNLFKPFSSQKDAKHPGTGLGLAISKSLVELMGGDIGVDNQTKNGSSFWFTATLRTDSHDYLGSHHVPANKIREKARLLIVSSDSSTSEALTMYAYARGIDHVAVHTIEEAKQLVYAFDTDSDSGKPIRVFVDMSNRTLDPFTLIEEIAVSSIASNVRWIALTHIDSKDYHKKLKEAGFAKVLVKPFRFNSFLHSISNDFDQQVETREDLPAFDAANAHSMSLSSRAVLLVEDNPALRELATRQLKRLGIDVVTASDGMEAVTNAASNYYDLILMDCQMPVMDGFEATKEIRKIEGSGKRHTPIVALTASVLPQDREKCFAAGMDEFLTKPVSLDDIRGLLKRWMTNEENVEADFIEKDSDKAQDSSEHEALSELMHKAKTRAGLISDTGVREDFAPPMPVDKCWLKEQYGEEAIVEILQTFSEEAGTLMKSLKRAALANQFAESAKYAHHLAGIAAVIGARQMHAQSINMEYASKDGDTYRANVAMDDLQRAFDDVMSWIYAKR